MPRKKKDGRYINYYIDRQVYERLEQYADEKGQQMTTAIERILKDYLDQYESEQKQKGESLMYCQNCNILVNHTQCPLCGSKQLREPDVGDYCYLAEKDSIWAGALSDVLTQNSVPFVTKNVLGAGLAAKMGPMLERTRFYVPYSHYETAQSLEEGFFSVNGEEA